ncbi:DUF4184 family protein [Terrabacter terrigena]|uniref:DUF4184 family protein n=1 Tax=Terrabacter terrigena TaxID=574718 RepID=A0ABW3MTM9_9MICO
MPFTPSHAIVAVPLQRLGLPFAAVAAGAMTPDVAVFLPGVVDYGTTHSLRGVLTVDAALAVVLVLVWWVWLRGPVVDVAPAALRHRVDVRGQQPRGSLRWWALVVAGALLGAATHVGWDAFTHPGAWGPEHLPVLRTQVGPLSLTKWLQYASGVLGLAGLLAWSWRQLRSRPAVPGEPQVLAGRSALRALPVVGAGLGVAVSIATAGSADGLHRALVRAVTSGGVGGALGVLTLAAGWTVMRRLERSRPGTVRPPAREGSTDR